ncbi:hypothetical protein BJX68DRAFT_264684 [Aspergillus pseudodeflectus]|uniref:C2H2-type domain-containing protein n=1 Tax=Aspergillus pseudodeflectus TaxID=176178 RepID=A0ABR4KRA9_9EURO
MEKHALDWKKDAKWTKAVAKHREVSRQLRDLDERYSTSVSETERRALHEKLVMIWKSARNRWYWIGVWRNNILHDDTADPKLLEGIDWSREKRKWRGLEQAHERHLQEHRVFQKRLWTAHQHAPQDSETRDSVGEKGEDQTTPSPPRSRKRPRPASSHHRILLESASCGHEQVNASNPSLSNDGYRPPLAMCEAQAVTPVARPINDYEAVTRRFPHSLCSDSRAYISSDEEDFADTDCLSITVDSEHDMEMAVASDAVIECALRRILREYRAGKQCGQTNGSEKGKTVVYNQAPPYRPPTSLGMNHGRNEETATDGSSSSFPLSKKQNTGQEQQEALACPFWKRNPREYRRCFRYKLSRIRDVKQHIHRCHHPPWRCMRCGEIFPSEETREAHARADQACAVRHVVHDDLSLSQMKALTRRAKPKYPVEEQWYGIWDILFPGAERPASPYIDGVLSVEISSFQEFYQTRGPAILREALRESFMDNSSMQEVQQYSDLVLRAA